MSTTPARDGGDPGPPASAAAALGEVWEALDALPRARAAAPLAATTLEMVATAVEPAPPGGGAGPRWRRWWLGPVATVCAALVCGLVAGRITAPDPDEFMLRDLPLVRHLDLLRELHSVAFLEELDRIRPQPPRRLLVASGRIDLQAEQARLASEITALRMAGPWGDAGRAAVAERRREVAGLPPDERERLRAKAAELAERPHEDRRRLENVAAAIVDPRADGVREAARLWRLWVAASNPLDREQIIDLDAARRLEWMRRESRPDAFAAPRPRGPNGEFRRPQGPRFPDGPRGDAPAPDQPPPDRQGPRDPDMEGQPPDGPGAFRRPRRADRQPLPDGPGQRRRPGPLSPDPPDPAGPPPVDAGETRAAPD